MKKGKDWFVLACDNFKVLLLLYISPSAGDFAAMGNSKHTR